MALESNKPDRRMKMGAKSCLLSSSIPWIAAIGFFLALAHSSELGLVTVLLTTSALILCPVIVSCSVSCHSKSVLREESKAEPEKTDAASKENQESDAEKEDKVVGDYVLSSSETLSDFSESIEFDHTSSSEDSENEWSFRENPNQNTVLSDGSISDEESLIEIALPERNQYLNSKKQVQEQQSWYGFQQKWSDCSIESHFRHQNWMEMMNEEENLIEIDIFMGNIKSTRFEIEA